MESRSQATYNSKILLKKIKSQIEKDFDFQMNDLLSICDSEIEKLLLIQFLRYFQVKKLDEGELLNEFSFPQFILDYQFPYMYKEGGDDEACEKILKEVQVKRYRFIEGCFQKYIGYQVKGNAFDKNKYDGQFHTTRQEICIYPQFFHWTNEKLYKIDIAFVLNRWKDNKIVETRKIALECDGYDYHSSPEQKRNDDIRARRLKLNEWKEVFRYSGKEIVQMSNDDFDVIFSEIMTMLYL
jgi:hypothetical protein